MKAGFIPKGEMVVMGKGMVVRSRMLTNLGKEASAQESNLSDRLTNDRRKVFYPPFIQSADGGELRCETSGFETRTRNVCEEKFETECKTIQV